MFLSIIKRPVCAFYILFQSLIKTHVAPPVHFPVTSWDLNLVLSVLQKQMFEPIKDILLSFLTH